MTDTTTAPETVKVEEKLFQNRYLVDEGRPHVCVRDPARVSASLQSLALICPAGCWATRDDGTVEPSLDGCLECGTCRIVTGGDVELDWNYPRGGYGIQYKFG